MSEAHTSDHSLDKSPADEQEQAVKQAEPTSIEPVTPQNTQVAGAATDEQHALLSDNVSGSGKEGWHEKANRLAEDSLDGNPGYKSTGSYTGSTGGQK